MAESPVSGTSAAPDTVTVPIFAVDDNPVTLISAAPETVTLPTAEVAALPVAS